MTNQLRSNEVEAVSRVLAEYITNSQITHMLETLGMYDMDAGKSPYVGNTSKWMRLFNAIANYKDEFKATLSLHRIIEHILDPTRFISKPDHLWYNAIVDINRIIQFRGFTVNDSGKVIKTIKTETFSEGTKRYKSLKLILRNLHIHPSIIALCRPEILSENYYHLIFEASKSILEKVRSISYLQEDGNTLIESCFKEKLPLIVLNKLITDTERSEYLGLKFLLKSLVCLYRNPKAHELKAYSVDNEDDAVNALLLMSHAHRLLDKCSRNSSIPL